MYINKVRLRNGQTIQRALIEPTLWGVCDTEGNVANKVVSLTEFALVQGVQVTIRFTNSNTASSPTLNINNTGNKGIIYQGVTIPLHMLVGGVNYQFIYNGTNYELVSAATQWAAPETVYVNLANNSNATTLQGGSNTAEVLGVSGILGLVNGGTNASTHIANRIVWSTVNNSNEIMLQAGGNHYIDAQKIAVNYASQPDANFYVSGTTLISSNTANDGTAAEFFKVGNMSTRYLSIGANGLQAYAINNNNVLSGRLELQPAGGTLYIGASNAIVTAHLYGVYNFYSALGFNFKGFAESSADLYVPLWFSVQDIDASTLELKANTGVPAYSNNLSYNAATHFIRVNGGGGIMSSAGALSVLSAADLTLGSGAENGIIFKRGTNVSGGITAGGTLYVGSPTAAAVAASNSKLYVDGPTYLNGDVTLNGTLIPSGTQILGTSTHRIGGLLIGTADSYGNAFEPIYWNAGVPAVVSVVQKQSFTIANESDSVTLTNSAYNTNTIVLGIVVISGGANLQAPLSATPDTGSLIVSTTQNVTGIVSGYVITARGVELSQGG